MEKKYLVSKVELAKLLSISTRSVDKLVSSNRIESVRVGTRRLFDPDSVTASLKAGAAAPENGGLN